MNTTRTFLIDLSERALKTFLQAAGATVSLELAGSGLSVGDLPSQAMGEKVATAAIVAGVAAVFSLLTSVVSGLRTQTASASVKVADASPALAGNHALTSVTAGLPPVYTSTAPVPHVAIYNTPATTAVTAPATAGSGLLDPGLDLNGGQQPVSPDPFMEGGGANPDSGGPAVDAPAALVDPAALGGS